MTTTKITKTTKTTYLGRKAEVTEVRKGGPHSERVVITRWVDQADERNGGHPAGTVVLRHIEGDGRKSSFKVHTAAQVVTGDPIAAAQTLLGA